MATTDKQYLINLAREVRKSLKAQKLTETFAFMPRLTVRANNSGGWSADIGAFTKQKCIVEVWLDQFTAHEKRKIYYCIYSKEPEGIQKLVSLAKPYLGAHLSVSPKHWSDTSAVVQLKIPLSKKDFGKPVFEKYPKQKEYLYGIYEFEKLGLQRNETRRMIERIVEFVVTINEALSKAKIRQDAEIYKAVENRKSVQRHIQRERNSHLVVLRKQLDNYKCQVCGFDYSKIYGELGVDFAEAHHIVPLSKDDGKRTTTIEDLITVCANCHRMLHRLKGSASDVGKLKSIVRSHKKAISSR